MLSCTSTPPTLAARVEYVSKESSGSLADLLQGEMRAWTPARGTPSWLIGDPELLLCLDRVRHLNSRDWAPLEERGRLLPPCVTSSYLRLKKLVPSKYTLYAGLPKLLVHGDE